MEEGALGTIPTQYPLDISFVFFCGMKSSALWILPTQHSAHVQNVHSQVERSLLKKGASVDYPHWRPSSTPPGCRTYGTPISSTAYTVSQNPFSVIQRQWLGLMFRFDNPFFAISLRSFAVQTHTRFRI